MTLTVVLYESGEINSFSASFLVNSFILDVSKILLFIKNCLFVSILSLSSFTFSSYNAFNSEFSKSSSMYLLSNSISFGLFLG